MESALTIVEIVTFRANERCLGDLGLFKDVQEMVAATTRCVQPSPWTDREAPGLSHDLMPVTDGPSA